MLRAFCFSAFDCPNGQLRWRRRELRRSEIPGGEALSSRQIYLPLLECCSWRDRISWAFLQHNIRSEVRGWGRRPSISNDQHWLSIMRSFVADQIIQNWSPSKPGSFLRQLNRHDCRTWFNDDHSFFHELMDNYEEANRQLFFFIYDMTFIHTKKCSTVEMKSRDGSKNIKLEKKYEIHK